MNKYHAELLISGLVAAILIPVLFHNEGKILFAKFLRSENGIVWPGNGEAAIGSVRYGVMASSSEKEKPSPMASMAKVVTALAVMEKHSFRLGQEGLTYTITKNDLAGLNAYLMGGGSVLPIRVGMKMTQYQALQRMLIASDNNVADILAERVFGSKEAYLLYAGDMLKRMGLRQTIVADASGFSPSTVSTPSELVQIGIAALKIPVIAGIVAQRQVWLPVAGLIKNTNQLLGTEGISGIKTGTTEKAGSCLLFAAVYTDREGQTGTFVGVIMGAKNHRNLYSESRDLLLSAKHVYGAPASPVTAGVTGPPAQKGMDFPAKRKIHNE